MIRAASRAAVRATASSAVAASAVMSATAAAMEAAATTTAVETTTTAAAVTRAPALRERGRRANQRHGSDCAEQNLEESGPVHGCYLHPANPQRCGRPERRGDSTSIRLAPSTVGCKLVKSFTFSQSRQERK